MIRDSQTINSDFFFLSKDMEFHIIMTGNYNLCPGVTTWTVDGDSDSARSKGKVVGEKECRK